jgi:hypothetical protein
MCLSAYLTETLYSPGAKGKYETDTVPSLLSWQLISALLGPSTASDNPPNQKEQERYIVIRLRMEMKLPDPAFLVEMVKLHDSPQTP